VFDEEAPRKFAYEYAPQRVSDFEAEARPGSRLPPPDLVADYILIIADHADHPIERDNNDRGYVWLGGEAARST
jgi:hypothetical protein